MILTLLLSQAKGAFASDLMIMNAIARPTLSPQVKTSAVYLMLMNHGKTIDRLLSISTPAAEHATLHETTIEADVAKMRALDGLDIEPGAMLEFKPGAMHIMLTGLKAPLKMGDHIELDLIFKLAGHAKIQVEVGGAAETHTHVEAN